MTDLNNSHDLVIGGDGVTEANTMNGFLDDLRINTIKARYPNSFTPSAYSVDSGLGNESIRRPILVNNLVYSPVEQIHMEDIEISNTTFGERSSGQVTFTGRYSDGTTFNPAPYRTITQLSGFQYGSINSSGFVTTNNIRYETGVITGKIHTRHKGILEKEFTIIVNDTIQHDLNLIDALSVAGIGSVVCIDAGDDNSATSSVVGNLSGGVDFDYSADTSLVGTPGVMTNYFTSSSGVGGLQPINGTTRSWSDGLHNGSAYTFCCVTNSTDFTLFATWNNSTSDRGVRCLINGSEIRVQHYGRATSPTAETALTVFTDTPNISGWTFIAGSVTPGGDIFFRRNKSYVKVKGYRRGTTNTNLSTPQDKISGITLSSPSPLAPGGQFNIMSAPGNSPEGASQVAFLGFSLGGATEDQLDAIYDSIKERYSLPD